jgi:hypothetical protein
MWFRRSAALFSGSRFGGTFFRSLDGDFDADDFGFAPFFFGFRQPCFFVRFAGNCFASPFGFSSFGFGNFGLYGFGGPLLFANYSSYWPSAAPANEYSPYASEPGCTPSGEAAANAETAIVLKGGMQFYVTDYWIADDQLVYLTDNGAHGSVPVDDLDLGQTVDLNWQNCISFTLRSGSAPHP